MQHRPTWPLTAKTRWSWRHVLTGLVLAGFLVSFVLGVSTLSGAGDIVNHLLDDDTVWPASQAHGEVVRLESALLRQVANPTPQSGAEVAERLDALSNAVSVLETGEIAAHLAEAGLDQPVRGLRELVSTLQPLQDSVAGGGPAAAAAVRQALATVQPDVAALHGWTVAVVEAHRADLLAHVQGRTQAIWLVVVSLGGLVASGFIFMLLLSLEIQSGRRKTAAAEASRSAAAAAQQRLVDAIETIPEGFALYDADDRLVLCNRRYRDIYRASAPAIRLGATFEDVIRYGVELGQYAEAVGNEEAWIAERVRRHQTPTGPVEQRLNDRRWLRIEERRTSEGGIVGVRVDITGIRRAQDLLSRAEQIADLGHFNIDVASGETVFSAHLYRILGLPAAQAASTDLLLDRFSEPERGHLDRALEETWRDGRAFQGVFSSVEIDGETRWFVINLAPDAGPSGEIQEILGTIQDITTQKTSEERLAAATAEAKTANAAKSQFLSIMSHEIRTPMNGIAGALNLVEHHRLDPHDAEMIDLARRSADRLRTVLNDVLDFTRMESGRLDLEPVPFDPRAFLREARTFWMATATEKGLRLDWSVDVMVPERLVADTGRLRQIVDNLISNALKFTEKGGVRIAMEVVHEVGTPDATETQPTHLVRLSVTDTGPGIAESDRPKVFADFSQLRAGGAVALTGSGLGLAICRRLCSMMDGRIDFVSRPGHGTRFLVEVPLPVADAATEVRRPFLGAPGEGVSAVLQGLRVLAAEDNPTNQVVIRHMLERFGCTVDLAGNGREAVDAVATRPYDLVLMDVSMPVMDGMEAAGLIRSQHGALPPIIGYTAHAMTDDRRRFREAGMDAVLAKPVQPDELAATICMVLERAPQRPPDTVAAPAPAAEALADPVPAAVAAVGMPGEESEDMFDTAAVAVLRDSLDPDTYDLVVRQYRTDVESILETLDTAYRSGDWRTVDRASHTLAGASATMGAKPLEAVARVVNTLSRRGDGATITEEMIAAVHTAAGRTLADDALFSYAAPDAVAARRM
ncbi:MAG: response regulator [Rhodospirillaceae bacterium]|nr:response regulator [Rhodospirillaceae bacterium]